MLEQAKKFLLEITGKSGRTRLLAAVSGGLDSMCLLELVSTWGRENGLTVTAAHFNHRLRGATADRDEAFVRDWCALRGIPFVSGGGDTRALARREHLTVEEAGRKLRYAFLDRAAAERNCDWILTAHHADDSAETMLLNLLRGTGSAGLAGIPKVRGNIARPFRNVTRAELTQYAEKRGVPHVEDETNETDGAARNVIRHRVLPALREINPRAVENMIRAAEILGQEDEALWEAAARLEKEVRPTPEGVCVVRKELTATPPAVQARLVLRMMETVCGHRKDLTAAHTDAVLQLGHSPLETAVVSLPYGMRARNRGGELWIERTPHASDAAAVAVGRPARFGEWTVSLGNTPEKGWSCALSPAAAEKLTVTVWRSDDRLKLPGSRGRRTLKRLCADAGIPPTERDLLPVLRVEDRPAAVPGVGMDTEFLPEEGGGKLFVTFIRNRGEQL